MPYADPDKQRAHGRAWKAARMKDPDYAERIREQRRNGIRRYRMKNPVYAKQWARVGDNRWHRAAISDDGSINSDVLNDLMATIVCPYCCEPMQVSGLHLDHIVPLSKGGSHSADNLAACCDACNQSKFNLSLVEFLLRRINHHRS